MSRIAQGILAGLTSLGLVLGTAQAAGAWTDWNDYTISGLGEWVLAPTNFEVVVDGPDAVCSMTFDDVTLNAAPWVFTFDTEDEYKDVEIGLCNGGKDAAWIRARVPYDLGDKWLTTDWGDPEARVYNRTGTDASVVVTDSKGKVVAEGVVPANDSWNQAINIGKAKKTQKYTLTVNGVAGVASQELVVPVGWSMMLGRPTFAPCASLTWTYKPGGRPADAKTMKKDIEGGLKRISKITGLTFTYTDGPADITYSWEDMGRGGPSGVGGTDGTVEFNSKDNWVTDRNAGFKLLRGYLPGRGWLVIHETLHVLGFGHVDDRTQVMNPLAYSAKFGPGDLEGLNTVYPSAGCKTRP